MLDCDEHPAASVPLGFPLLTFASILALLRFTTPILDSPILTIGRFAILGPGLAILTVATLAVLALSSNVSLRRRSVPAQP